MKGRSRTECSYIKNLFDQFIEGPAIENREIEELGAKYEEFYNNYILKDIDEMILSNDIDIMKYIEIVVSGLLLDINKKFPTNF